MADVASGGPPPVGVGHVVMTVADVGASHRFYSHLGLRGLHNDQTMAIMELRGGTHLLLFRREGDAAPPQGELTIGPPQAGIDLMIAGRTRPELEAFRSRLLAQGLPAAAIPDQTFFGHHIFKVTDPDGNEVSIATSHASELPV